MKFETVRTSDLASPDRALDGFGGRRLHRAHQGRRPGARAARRRDRLIRPAGALRHADALQCYFCQPPYSRRGAPGCPGRGLRIESIEPKSLLAENTVVGNEGQAAYIGPAGGLYAYVPGSDWGEDEGRRVIDEYEGAITITADFADSTLSGCIGCIGCVGDLVTRRAHFGVFLGDEVRDVQAVAADYELHLGRTPFNPDGTFEHTEVEVRHPKRAVTHSEGHWGGALSNIPDQAGNPRLVAGFSGAYFEESDGSAGAFFGTFVALSGPL